MEADDIHLTDWARLLSGEAPAIFYLELILRALVLFSLLVFALRLLGQRMAAQLNRMEQAAVVTLAASIGVPLMSPERGLLPAVLAALIVIGVTYMAARLSERGGRAQAMIDGELSPLVKDSVLQLPELK